MNELSENLKSTHKGWEGSGTDPLDALGDFGRGLVYGAIESPTNGVTQLVNAAIEPLSGSKIGKLDITGLEGDLMSGRCNALSAEAGASLGGVIPLYTVNKVSGKLLGNSMGAAKTAEILGTAPGRAVVYGSLRQALLTGTITGGVLTPTPEGEDLLEGRMKSACVGAVNFAVFNTFNEMGREVLGRRGQIGSLSTSQFIARELPLTVGVGAAAGAGSGVISANIDSVVYGQRLATSEEMTKRVLMDGIMGGGFALAHQAHSRFVKAAPLSESQKLSVSFKTVGESDSSWIKLYEKSIPSVEREPVDSIQATMSRSKNHVAYDATTRGKDGQPLPAALRHESMKTQWANGEPLVSGVLNTAVAPNGKTLAFSFVELYAGRDYLKHDPAFMMAAYLGVDPNLQSAGLGAHYWNKQLLPSLREQFPKHIGLAVEIESSRGLPPDSQPQKRARFYKDRTGMDKLDLEYELPLFQPDDAPRYIPQREIPKYLIENGLPAEDGPIPADLIWKSFSSEPVSGQVARNIVERIYHSGYGVEPATATRPGDPYLQQRTSLIDGSRADLVVPMHLEPGPKVPTTGLRSTVDWLGRTVNYFDGNGFAAGSITRPDID